VEEGGIRNCEFVFDNKNLETLPEETQGSNSVVAVQPHVSKKRLERGEENLPGGHGKNIERGSLVGGKNVGGRREQKKEKKRNMKGKN